MRAVLSLIESEPIEKPVIVGHYSGGQLAIRIALEHPDAIRGAVSIDGPLAFSIGGRVGPILRQDRNNAVKRMAAERVPQDFWEQFVRDNASMLVSNPGRSVLLGDMMASAPFGVAKRYWIETMAEDLWHRVTGLTIPLLVVVPLEPDSTVEALAEKRKQWKQAFSVAPTASIVFVEESRQFVMYDKPEALDEAIATFLALPAEAPAGEDDQTP
jgi:pimeloyl-ACP methyl ester carboxylesterase